MKEYLCALSENKIYDSYKIKIALGITKSLYIDNEQIKC